MRVMLSDRWGLGLSVIARNHFYVNGLVLLSGKPHWVVNSEKTECYSSLLQKLKSFDGVPVSVFMQAAQGRALLPWDWLEPIECFATHLPNEMPEGFAAEPLDEGDALRGEGFEYCVKVTLNQELWEELSGEYDPALGLAELMEILGFQGVLLPPNCPL
jgi:hypothetical protein